ncbi:unnamed protein product, partial [Staurois parvus]
SWGPGAIGDHGAPVSLPKLKKAYEKDTRGISWGPLLTPGARAVPEFPNAQSAPAAMSLLKKIPIHDKQHLYQAPPLINSSSSDQQNNKTEA